MNDVIVARGLHVLAVVLWIGGVGMVTTVLLPALRRHPNADQRAALFEALEGRFGRQARYSILLAGTTGLYMLARLDAWDRFLSWSGWWLHAMVLLWLVFAILLFVLEPLVLHRLFADRARRDPQGTFRLVGWFHVVLLTLSLITVFGAVTGSHGLSLAG